MEEILSIALWAKFHSKYFGLLWVNIAAYAEKLTFKMPSVRPNNE